MIKIGLLLASLGSISAILAFNYESVIATIVSALCFVFSWALLSIYKPKKLNKIIGDCEKGVICDCDCCHNMVFFPMFWVNVKMASISTSEKCADCEAITHIDQIKGLPAIRFKCPNCREIDICILEPQEIIKGEIDGIQFLTYVPGESRPICQYCDSTFRCVMIMENNEIQAKLAEV